MTQSSVSCWSRRMSLWLEALSSCLDGKKKDGLYSDRVHQSRRCERGKILFEEPISDDNDILLSTSRNIGQDKSSVPFVRGIDMQRLSRHSARRIVENDGFIFTCSETVARSAVWRQLIRVCKCPCFSLWSYFVFRSLVGMYLRQIGIDCNITLEESRISPSRMIILRFILRHMFELLNFRHLLSSHLFVASTAVWKIGVPPISFYSYRRSLIRFHSAISEASKIPLLDHFWLPFQVPLRCSVRLPFMLERSRRTS